MKTRLLFVGAYFVLIHLGTSLVLKRTIEGPNCRKIQKLKNGIIHQLQDGRILNFHCLANYVLEGPKYAFCVDGKWNTHMPSCLPPNVTPSLSCDFETADLCGWTQDLNQNFDWTRTMYSVHLSTGPSYDHTKGPGGDGYFMYIDGSTGNVNDEARLISPTYTRETNDTCLEFYYHIYGFDTELRISVVKANEIWNWRSKHHIYHENQEDDWWYYSINLEWIHHPFQVVFEGVSGHSFISDIAIDDVKIIENCSDESITSATEPYTGETTPIYESCNNRCNTNNTQDISCSCDEDCFENNSCCPDYFELCVLASDSYVTESTSEDYVTEYEDYVTEYEDTTVHILPTEKEFPTVIQKEYHPVLPDKTVPTQKNHVPNKGTVVAVFICFIVVGILGLVFLAKRYISRNWMCVRRRRSENGDRKNEVRFLTGDEVLGIRLQLPHSETQ